MFQANEHNGFLVDEIHGTEKNRGTFGFAIQFSLQFDVVVLETEE